MEPGMGGLGAYILGVMMKLKKNNSTWIFFIYLLIFMLVLCKVAYSSSMGRVLCDMDCRIVYINIYVRTIKD